MTRTAISLHLIVIASLSEACSTPPLKDGIVYDSVTLIGTLTEESDVTVRMTFTNAHGPCVKLEDGRCVKIDAGGEWCQSGRLGPLDALIVAGEQVSAVCYPMPSGTFRRELQLTKESERLIPRERNGFRVTFAPSTDGQFLEGDFIVEASDVSILGNGLERTVIGGNLIIRGSHVRVRDVTVAGNVIVEGDNSSLLLAAILGGVSGSGNHFLLGGSVAAGQVLLKGKGHVLVGNGLSMNEMICADNSLNAVNRGPSDTQVSCVKDESTR